MSTAELKANGLIAWSYAALSIATLSVNGVPLIVLGRQHPSPRSLAAELTISLLFVYVLTSLSRLLHDLCGFRGADKHFTVFIGTNVVFTLSDVYCKISGAWPSVRFEEFLAISIIPLAIVGVLFSLSLLSLPDPYNGLFGGFASAFLIASSANTTIVLVPVGMLATSIGLALLGRIYFKLAKSSSFYSAIQEPVPSHSDATTRDE